MDIEQSALASLTSRLLAATDVDPEKTYRCIEWTGAKNEYGYGRIACLVNGKYRNIAVHRASWLVFRGQIPKGMMVCHSCDRPSCYNPRHLFLGDGSDNMSDSYDKKRSRYRPPRFKEPKYYLEILSDFKPYEFTRKMLAEKYGVPILHVNYVIKRGIKHGVIQRTRVGKTNQ